MLTYRVLESRKLPGNRNVCCTRRSFEKNLMRVNDYVSDISENYVCCPLDLFNQNSI